MTLKMFSLTDGRIQLAAYNKKSNNIIMTVLGMKSPNQILKEFWAVTFEIAKIAENAIARAMAATPKN